MKFYSFSEEWIKPSALLVKFQGSRNIHLCCKNFFLTAILCPKSHISYVHSLELKPQSEPREALRNQELDILSPPKSAKLRCVRLCVWVWWEELWSQSNSSDEVTRWASFERCPELATSSMKHVSPPWTSYNKWPHITTLLTQPLSMITMIWSYVFYDPLQIPFHDTRGPQSQQGLPPHRSECLALFPTAPSALTEHYIRDH